MNWPPPELEDEWNAHKAREESAERKGMFWAVIAVLGLYAATGAAIYFRYF